MEELQQERRPNEERYEKLKKRNMELSLMTKRLDEKARQIQIQKVCKYFINNNNNNNNNSGFLKSAHIRYSVTLKALQR